MASCNHKPYTGLIPVRSLTTRLAMIAVRVVVNSSQTSFTDKAGLPATLTFNRISILCIQIRQHLTPIGNGAAQGEHDL